MAVGAPNMDQFELYFKRADLDQDGRISGAEAVTFFQASALPKPVLAQIWTHADQNRAGSLGRVEFFNALKLITVAQRKLDLTSETVKAALYGPASAEISAPQMNLGALPVPQSNLNMASPAPQMGGSAPATSHSMGIRGPQGHLSQQNQVIRPPQPPLSNTMIQPQHGLPASAQPRPQASTSLVQNVASRPNGPTFAANGAGAKDSGGPIAGNGFAPSSAFGNTFSAALTQGNHNSPVPMSSTGGLPASSSNVPVQNGQMQSTLKHNQQVSLPNSSTIPVRAENVSSSQSSQPWPKITQSDVQKYTKVFLEVDTDRDGKITGEQARNLFLSWRLPRDILKQVWDLSDQDNDSMLSSKEFCIALYLMERYREGHPLPRVLPAGVMFEGIPLPQSSQGPAPYSAPVWRPPPGVQQAHGNTGPRQVPAAAARPPRPVPVPIPQDDEVQPRQQKPRVPVLEKHLVDQLSTEEQNSLNSKFKEATEADKKVVELEKEISEAKQQIEFYRSKMQEIVLYKSRCDTRLNEITERVSADKREVESLSKKYEDKYKQAGDVASKLTIEEATFRNIQDKKMELYRAIVKLDQEGKTDDIQVHVDRIQADLEEQVKALNDRCKMYGLRGKPTSLEELPFGWQPDIEGAADWDEQWDKFEDEGFTFIKELTVDVQNIIAPPKPKPSPVQNNYTSQDEGTAKVSSSDTNGKFAKLSMAEDIIAEDESNERKEDSAAKGSPDSPASRKAVGSDHAVKTQSEPLAAESVFSGDQKFDEPGWGTFDSHYDSDAASDLNATKPKDVDQDSHHENSFFDSDGWGLNPIRTEVPKNTIMFDSMPETPAYSYAGSPPSDNLFQNGGPFASAFADSVLSTPAYSSAGDFQRPFASAFADSVPSTPIFASNSPSEDRSFNNNFSRFDSFSSNTPQDSFSRFDSFRSTADSDFGHSLFEPRESFSRFDSMKSTNESSEFNHGFASFDDTDPFGSRDPFRSHDPFKTSVESETPRRDSVDSWRAF